jgi:hypothetical protein
MTKRVKGDVSPDWIIALLIFLVFVSWSFQSYSAVFRAKATPLEQVAPSINDAILANITSSVYEMPVTYTSPLQESGSIMQAAYYWNSDGEKNTTMVFSNISTQLSCKISGNTIYWQSDVVAGQNNFTIRVSNRTAAVMNCTGTFSTTGANVTIPSSGDRRIMLSSGQISVMNSTGYTEFKQGNGINREFRVSVEPTAGSIVNYGSVPPNSSNVFSRESWYKIEETNSNAKVTVLVW